MPIVPHGIVNGPTIMTAELLQDFSGLLVPDVDDTVLQSEYFKGEDETREALKGKVLSSLFSLLTSSSLLCSRLETMLKFQKAYFRSADDIRTVCEPGADEILGGILVPFELANWPNLNIDPRHQHQFIMNEWTQQMSSGLVKYC